jgi:hypothetical protein
MVEFVYVLSYGYEEGNEVLGVYRDLATAETQKTAIIRDRYDIPEDEVSDDKLDDELSTMYVYFEIDRMPLL